MKLADQTLKNMPKSWPLASMLGPSLIILGVGLGSGELIMWPYLTANYGLTLVWAAVIGITAQFFVNLEIERYALVTGESVFVGWVRLLGKGWAWWFLVSTLLPWVWPGIAASAATVLAKFLHITYTPWLAVCLLVLIGAIYSLGSLVYKTQEFVQKWIILLGVPFILLLTVWVVFISGQGLEIVSSIFNNIGHIPENISWSAFLAAIVYAGAGGNLNLAQSLYVREKGYGMGKYVHKLSSLLNSSKTESYDLTGYAFPLTTENLANFRAWWHKLVIEHLLVFWLTGVSTIILLMILSYMTVYGRPDVQSGINFILLQADYLKLNMHWIAGLLFLIIVAIMLFGTQFSVYGSNARMAAENLLLGTELVSKNISLYFYGFLWLQIFLGSVVLLSGFSEPLALVIVGAVLNAVSMSVYTGLLIYLNTNLPKPLRPSPAKIVILSFICLGYTAFSLFTLWHNFLPSKPTSTISTPIPTPTPMPFEDLTIPYLRAKTYASQLGELKLYGQNADFTSYLTSYTSDGLKINGLLTMPKTAKPETGYPAIVFVHGYIAPSIYTTTERYSEYVNFLARSGFVVFKIDLRGHGESEGEAEGAYYSSAYVIDTLNALAALKQTDFVDAAKIGLWGHSMAGNVTFRSFVVAKSIPALVIWGGAGFTYTDLQDYRIMDKSYRAPEQTTKRAQRRQDLRTAHGDFDPNNPFWRQVAPTNYLDGLTGKILLQHAIDDDVVSVEYSRNLIKVLDQTTLDHTLIEYPNGGHNITNPSFVKAMTDTVDFFTKAFVDSGY